MELTNGIGVDAALECVGTAQAITTAFTVARPGSTVGIVGVPHGEVPFAQTFFRNVGWRGGPAPARIYIPELLEEVLDGTINPGRVLDYETDLGPYRDGLRGHGRAPGHQVAYPGRIAVSATSDLPRPVSHPLLGSKPSVQADPRIRSIYEQRHRRHRSRARSARPSPGGSARASTSCWPTCARRTPTRRPRC